MPLLMPASPGFVACRFALEANTQEYSSPLTKDTEVLDGDDLKNYVCISNGHDGLNAFRVFYTPIRVVCANTLAMAEASVQPEPW